MLQATDQLGAKYELPLAVGDRLRLFARTNARCTDGLRGVIGVNGTVLEVTAIGAEGLRLRSASGREGLVAWDTLRDRESGRLQLTYGDALTIDATQGLTSTEHIEAMPADTRAVDAFKAYASGSRHRQATFIVVSERAERKEIAGRRPINDPRPIREADVWANMARNLARQPEKLSALAFPSRTDNDVYAPCWKAQCLEVFPRPFFRDLTFIGRSTEHRERHFGPLKRDCNFLHIAHGVVGQEALAYYHSAPIGLNIHAEPGLS